MIKKTTLPLILFAFVCLSLSSLHSASFKERFSSEFFRRAFARTKMRFTDDAKMSWKLLKKGSKALVTCRGMIDPDFSEDEKAELPYSHQNVRKALQQIKTKVHLEKKIPLEQLDQAKKETLARIMLIDNSEPCIDPETLELFKAIKTDMNITDDIPLLIFKKDSNNAAVRALGALTPGQLSNGIVIPICITLDLNYLRHDPIRLISVIRHELEHWRQLTNDPASYHIPSRESIFKSSDRKERIKYTNYQLEVGAEASSHAEMVCWKCLEHLAKKHARHEGSATHLLGYFSEADIQLYLDRDKREKCLCPAHTKMAGLPIAHQWRMFDQDFSMFKAKDFLSLKTDSQKIFDDVASPAAKSAK